MRFELPPLPFEKNALEPYLSAECIEIHYEKHHRTYLNKLNELILSTDLKAVSLEEVILRSKGAVFNNAAQVWNHSFYWNCLNPKPSSPGSVLLNRLEQSFDSFEKFESVFVQAATNVFGSGWTWLVENTANGKLSIETTSNAENPIGSNLKPLLTLDVWEHAYYIDYRNDRKKYLESVIKLLNWSFVENNLRNKVPILAA